MFNEAVENAQKRKLIRKQARSIVEKEFKSRKKLKKRAGRNAGVRAGRKYGVQTPLTEALKDIGRIMMKEYKEIQKGVSPVRGKIQRQSYTNSGHGVGRKDGLSDSEEIYGRCSACSLFYIDN